MLHPDRQMQIGPALSRSFLNAYPVLGLGLESCERDALIRHLPPRLKAEFIFEQHMQRVNLDWEPLKPMVVVSQGDFWIDIQDTSDPVSSKEYAIFPKQKLRSVDGGKPVLCDTGSLEYVIIHRDSGFGVASHNMKKYPERRWIDKLKVYYHFLSIEHEIEKLFRAFGWYGLTYWQHPYMTNTCERIGLRWRFSKGIDEHAEFGYDIDGQDIRTLKYWRFDLGPILPRVAVVLSRAEWLKEFHDCISSLTPPLPKRDTSLNRDASPKRRKLK